MFCAMNINKYDDNLTAVYYTAYIWVIIKEPLLVFQCYATRGTNHFI